MGAVLREIVIDCVDPHRVAAFWGQVLGWEVLADPEGNELCVLARRADGGT